VCAFPPAHRCMPMRGAFPARLFAGGCTPAKIRLCSTAPVCSPARQEGRRPQEAVPLRSLHPSRVGRGGRQALRSRPG
jgi:hypothetical protein